MNKDFIRPDEDALLRVLSQNDKTAAELIIRLAWQAGLNRPQIHALTWNQVSLDTAEIHLSTHTVPIHPDLLACLQHQRQRPSSQKSEYVVLTDARRFHPHSGSISRIATDALKKEEALKNVSLSDLRDDFIIRMVQQHGKKYTVQIAGIAMGTLHAKFGKYVSQSRGTVTEGNPSPKAPINTDRLLELLTAEGSSPAAISLWLSWKQNMTLKEITSLTWNQVNFEANTLHLEKRDSIMHPIVAQLLKELSNSGEDANSHVLLTPKSKKPFRVERLTVVIRNALCRYGLNSLYVGSLPYLDKQLEEEQKILQYIQENRFITRKNTVSLLNTTENIAWKTLNRMTQQNKLVRTGLRYYIPGTVVPPEEQPAAIIKYLKEVGTSTCGDIAEMLHTEKRACAWVLHKMVEEGSIIMIGQAYKLPEEKE